MYSIDSLNFDKGTDQPDDGKEKTDTGFQGNIGFFGSFGKRS